MLLREVVTAGPGGICFYLPKFPVLNSPNSACYAWIMPKYAQTMPKNVPKYAQNMPKNMINIAQLCPKTQYTWP